jgi:hypothetical protein
VTTSGRDHLSALRRRVTTHDDDILDFDFFDDAATREDPAPRESRRTPDRRPGGGSSGGRRPPSSGALVPLVRLVGLVAVAIVIVVVLVVWVQGCSSDHQRSSYQNYMKGMSTIGTASAQIGSHLAELLATPGLKQSDLTSQLSGLITQQEQEVTQAQQLAVPGPIRAEHDNAVAALQLRASGMQGLAQGFERTATSKDAVAAGQLLASQAQRLTASDVVWSDLFKGPATQELRNRSIDGVAVPLSVFVANPDQYTSKSMTLYWTRIHGALTGGSTSGVHGTDIEYTKVLPAGTAMSTSQETIVKISTALGFEVGVKNGGGFQEVQVKVTLTIPTQPNPIVKTATIPVIDPGETKTVTFTDFGTLPPGVRLNLRVDVAPVRGEKRLDNNTYQYPILTTLPG